MIMIPVSSRQTLKSWVTFWISYLWENVSSYINFFVSLYKFYRWNNTSKNIFHIFYTFLIDLSILFFFFVGFWCYNVLTSVYCVFSFVSLYIRHSLIFNIRRKHYWGNTNNTDLKKSAHLCFFFYTQHKFFFFLLFFLLKLIFICNQVEMQRKLKLKRIKRAYIIFYGKIKFYFLYKVCIFFL